MGIYKTLGLGLAWFFRAFLITAGIAYLYYGETVTFIMFLFMLILTLAPIMLEQLYDIEFHWVFELAISMMIALHMFGTMGAYFWIPMYDNLLHTFSSGVLAFIGFSLIFSYNYSGKIKVSLAFMGIFTFLWTMGIGAIWEIIEFIWDNIVVFFWGSIIPVTYEFGFMQNSLFDTMTDLSLDGAAAVLVAIFCVFAVRNAKKQTLEGMFRPFAKMIEHKAPKKPITEKK
ncbi:MAG: hypothetical protein PHO02_03600 [Candidatus Nanoarchaeia archaeon]|nr:hypothetical protein [Candidatus Nanoarchaeia archaeon]